MKIFFDEGVPEPLADDLPEHEIQTVRRLGLKGIKNGKLLALIESLGVELFITADKAMETQQALRKRPFAILVLSTNYWPVMQKHTLAIAEAVDRCSPGTISRVECGTFVPRRFRKLSEPPR